MLNIWKFSKSIVGRTKCPPGTGVWDGRSSL